MKHKKKYGQLMFPRGGIHWSALAATMTMVELVKTLQKFEKKLPLPSYTYKFDQNARGYDTDILLLANLFSPSFHYTVPHLTFTSPTSLPDKPLKITFVGGSFLTSAIESLNQSKIFSSIDFYFYFDMQHSQYKHNVPRKVMSADLGKNDIKNFTEIFNADVIILEENESVLQSDHITKLVSMLNHTQHAQLTLGQDVKQA